MYRDALKTVRAQRVQYGGISKVRRNGVGRAVPFLGAVARSDAQLIAMTIDQMVSKANNVPKEEALTVWGLPYKSYDSLSHSATISELAFKYYGGDMIRFENVVGVDIWKKWRETSTKCRDAAHELIVAIEAVYGRELGRWILHRCFISDSR
jgi:hypothetical protein